MAHDQLFKELLREFFGEFLELFLPDVAAQLDFSRVRFLDKEVFTDFPEGAEREADVLAEVGRRGGGTGVVYFHVEVEGKRSGLFPKRMWRYFALFTLRHDRPLFPVVLYLSPGTGGIVEEKFVTEVLGRTVNEFTYTAIGLPDLSADDYRDRENLLGPALAALMKTSASGRLMQKWEALLRIARSRLDDARKGLLASVVETYLKLDATEQEAFAQRARDAEGGEEVREMLNVFEERGRVKGIEQGIEQGIERGVLEGRRQSLLLLMRRKFGALPEAVERQVQAVESRERLEELLGSVLVANSPEEMGLGRPSAGGADAE